MAKMTLIVTMSITIVSGCALLDGLESETDPRPVPASVIKSVTSPCAEKPQVGTPVVPVVPPTAPQPIPKMDREHIRHLQVRLRETGFDPGPVDGVPGTKTKLALARLSDGCAKAAGLVEKLPVKGMGNSFSYAETLAVQMQLRNAGFNPGPVDGIFGKQTKDAFARFQSGCPLAREYAVLLGEGLPEAHGNSLFSEAASSTESREALKPISNQQPASREEIRILQLRLRDAGFDPGPFDGVMGPKTRRALAQYEARHLDKTSSVQISSGQY